MPARKRSINALVPAYACQAANHQVDVLLGHSGPVRQLSRAARRAG